MAGAALPGLLRLRLGPRREPGGGGPPVDRRAGRVPVRLQDASPPRKQELHATPIGKATYSVRRGLGNDNTLRHSKRFVRFIGQKSVE